MHFLKIPFGIYLLIGWWLLELELEFEVNWNLLIDFYLLIWPMHSRK